jgi:hypothetical protein
MDNTNQTNLFFDKQDNDEAVPFTIPDEIQNRCAELDKLFHRHFHRDSADIGRVLLYLFRDYP